MGLRCKRRWYLWKSLSEHVSTSHLEDDKEDTFESEELIQSDSDPWIKRLNILWDTHFEQREPPTEDKVTQVNLRDEVNPKLIFISKGLSPIKKEDLIQLIREYIGVFIWNYEDMPGLDPQIAMHRLNINPDAKPVKQQLCPEIMKTIESEVKKVYRLWFCQGKATSRLGGQYRFHSQEEWKDLGLHRLLRFKCRLS